MSRSLPPTYAAFGLLPVLMIGAPLAAAFLDSPPPAHTGGFGEPTCAQCHFDVQTPDPDGSLALTGLPREISPGTRYLLTVTLRHPRMESSGFQIAARYAEGERRGEQAGAVRAIDERVSVFAHRGVSYAQQTARGAALSHPQRSSWQIEWTAPVRLDGPVIFHMVGNAADGDGSQLGDHIYTSVATAGRAAETVRK